MNRRKMMGAIGFGAASLTTSGLVRADDHNHGEAHEEHLRTLVDCARICNETAHHSLEAICRTNEGSTGEAFARIHEATMDCQAFCVLTATLMARHSPMAHHAHAACAEACAQCAKTCQDAEVDSEFVQRCMEACKDCEKACRNMAGKPMEHHHHDHS